MSTAEVDGQQDDVADATPEPARRWAVPAEVLVWFGLLAPFVVIAAAWIGSDWFPVQDHAVLDLRLDDLFAGRPPLVGAFSRYGWSHPGPVWFYALAPFRLLGTDPHWIVVGSVMWFGAGVATTATLVHRRFGRAACTVAVVALLAAVSAGGWFAVLVPWNPHLAFAWYPVLLVLCLTGARGRVADLVAAMFVGSALVQLHVGYAVLVAPPLAAASALSLIERRSSLRPSRLAAIVRRRGVAAWTAATVALWAPPLVEQLRGGSEGNLALLLRFFRNPPTDVGPSSGWWFAGGVLGGAARRPFGGIFGEEAVEPFTGDVVPGSPWWMLPPVVLLGAAAVLAWRRGRSEDRSALLVAGAALLAGLVALARLVGDRWPYLFVWRYALVWFVVAVAVAVLARSSAANGVLGSGRRSIVVLVAAVLVAGSVTAYGSLERGAGSLLPFEDETRRLSAELLSNPEPSRPVTLVRFGSILEGVGDGILNVTDGAGWDVGVLPSLAYKYGEHRVVDPADAAALWLVTESSVDTSVAELVPGADTVAKITPLEPADDARLTALHAEVLAALVAHGRTDLAPAVGSDLLGFVLGEHGIEVDPDALSELEALNARVRNAGRCRCSVVAVPPSTPPDLFAALRGTVDLPES